MFFYSSSFTKKKIGISMEVISEKENESLSDGSIISIRGSVVDIGFENNLPSINTVIRTGVNKDIVIEVLAQLDDHRVRGIALTPTQGLSRGMVAETLGK